MRSIPRLVVDATVVFDETAAAKQQPRRSRMQSARSQVLAAYRRYETAVPDVGELERALMTDRQKEAMQHAYIAETAPMAVLRGDLLGRISVARCPFCGISESSTLDHYLPKEQYPEFAIFPKNLVPCCAICNTRKRDRIIDKGTKVRMFLHPCYDKIPDLAFVEVRARIASDALILSYQLTRPAAMALRSFQHLQSHFRELNLADRYRKMALEHLGGQYPALRRAYGAGEDAERVKNKLTEGAEDFEEVSGPNYWLAKLYRTLAGNVDFCDGGFEVVQPKSSLQ